MVRGLVFGMGLLLAALVQAQGQAALAVEVAQAARVAHERSLAADGVVVARELAAVNAQVAGVSLARLEADIGDRVQAGQVLARFDAALLQQELAQAQAQEARAQAALAQAKRNAARAGKLVQERAVRVSESEVAGVVAARPAEVGMTAGVGSPLFVLQVDGALEWQAQVSPEDAQRLKVGTPARVLVGEVAVPGRVRLFAPVADAQSRRVVVFVALERHADLRANLLLRGQFLFGKEEVWAVPVSALVREDGQDFVVLVEAGNRVRRQALVLGERLGDRVVVRDGLPEGARFVLRSGSFLQDGDVVRVVGE